MRTPRRVPRQRIWSGTFIVLILTLALWLSACASAPTSTTTAPDTGTDTPADTPTEAPAEAAPTAVEEAPSPSGSAETTLLADELTPNEDLSGTITVLTNRTDIVDTVFVEYAAQFNELYPNVTVEFEAITDYEGEVKIRMNTEDFGDVLLLPNIPVNQLPDFFEPLGSVEALDAKYMFVTEKAVGGLVYGLPITGNAQGIVYNKRIFEEAGITTLPTSSEEFIAAMQLIQDNTEAIPYYTNYAAGWPLTQWEGNRGSVTCNANYTNEMVGMEAPFAEGSAHYQIYKLMYDLVAAGLVEEDPSTTDWEQSKILLGTGEIASMVLGSWSIAQMEQAAEDPADIGYMPFPATVDGTICSDAGGDYKIGVNQFSENKEAATAWVNWFLQASNYAYDNGGIPPVKGSDLPPQLTTFGELGVEFVSQTPAPAGEEGVWDRIHSEGEVGLWDGAFGQRIVDAARGNSSETFDDIMADNNEKWAAGRAAAGGQ